MSSTAPTMSSRRSCSNFSPPSRSRPPTPERQTLPPPPPPIVVLTSNRTRDLHDALKRRCFYHWIGHPSVEREIEILRLHLPHLAPELAADVARAAAALRARELRKAPGIAESLDWAQTLQLLGAERLGAEVFVD